MSVASSEPKVLIKRSLHSLMLMDGKRVPEQMCGMTLHDLCIARCAKMEHVVDQLDTFQYNRLFRPYPKMSANHRFSIERN